MKYCVYMCLSKESEVLYFGKTNNIKRRLVEHRKNSKWINEVTDILYSELNTVTDMGIYELYYIDKFHPRYNVLDNKNEGCCLELKELSFKYYEDYINLDSLLEDMGIENLFCIDGKVFSL